MQLSQYKALLFDLDKTLTDMKQEVTPATIQALATLSQHGFKIGLCTGRHFATLKDKGLAHFALDDTHIVSGGAQVITSAGQVLWQKLIPLDSAMQLIQEVDDGQVIVYLQTRDRIYGNPAGRDHWNLAQSQVKTKPTAIYPIDTFPDPAVPILVIKRIGQDIADYLSSHPSFNAKVMHDYDGTLYADVMWHGVDKTTGLKHWCQINGVKPEEIIGFGDSENDEEFLTHIGYAVAMGNAVDSIKQIADEVIGRCDEDGVAKWVEASI